MDSRRLRPVEDRWWHTDGTVSSAGEAGARHPFRPPSILWAPPPVDGWLALARRTPLDRGSDLSVPVSPSPLRTHGHHTPCCIASSLVRGGLCPIAVCSGWIEPSGRHVHGTRPRDAHETLIRQIDRYEASVFKARCAPFATHRRRRNVGRSRWRVCVGDRTDPLLHPESSECSSHSTGRLEDDQARANSLPLASAKVR